MQESITDFDTAMDMEAWSDCDDIFGMLSDLELQPDDVYLLRNLPQTIFSQRHELHVRSSREETTSQERPKGIHGKESKGKKQAREGTKNNCLPDECYSDGVIRKKRCSERRRRKRINAKMTSLRQLLPNSYKGDQASILEDAIKYIQSLKLLLNEVFKSSGQNQLQPMFLHQVHVLPMTNPAFGIGEVPQFVAPCSYGSMVTPQSIQVASIPQCHPVLCTPHYFAAGSFPTPFESTEHR